VSTDSLTGLVNRREFENRVERALRNRRSREIYYAICYLDLDQFSNVTELCGYSSADALLGQVGRLLNSKMHARDTLARLGEDFAVLLENCSLDEAMLAAEALRGAISRFEFSWNDLTFRLTASIGVAQISSSAEDASSLISAAVTACRSAKDAGRNRVRSFAENAKGRGDMQWAAQINAALHDGRFELHRMAIQPLQQDELALRYELLPRASDEDGHTIAPNDFDAAADGHGLGSAIDRWVVENALQWLASKRSKQQEVYCSIDLSAESLCDDKFLPFVIDQFKRLRNDGSRLCFGIPETAVVANASQANHFAREVKALGCKIALDRFGTGVSSLSHLKHFPADFLKIDGGFVREVSRDPIERELVRSIVAVARAFGMRTIAECSETQEIVDTLRMLGVDYAQGDAVSRPERIHKDS
jgi:diguanylate cyclase (GGDEF)-like protein